MITVYISEITQDGKTLAFESESSPEDRATLANRAVLHHYGSAAAFTQDSVLGNGSLWGTLRFPEGGETKTLNVRVSFKEEVREEDDDHRLCDCGSGLYKTRRAAGGVVCQECEERYWDDRYDMAVEDGIIDRFLS